MSSAPCTFGTMITSSWSPISVTSVTRSSRPHGLSRELTRVHSWVAPKSVARAMSTRPWRDFSLFSALTASSRLPSSTSTVPTMSGTLAAIFALPGSKKWIARLGRAGMSRSGAGAPTARGAKKSLAERVMAANYRRRRCADMTDLSCGRCAVSSPRISGDFPACRPRSRPTSGRPGCEVRSAGAPAGPPGPLPRGRIGGCPGRALGLDPGRTPFAPRLDLGVDVALPGDHRRPGRTHRRRVDRLADAGVEVLDLAAYLRLDVDPVEPAVELGVLLADRQGGRQE